MADQLPGHFPQAAELLEEAEEDLLAFMHFPPSHWSTLASTNPLERPNREIGRRTEVVGIFPNRTALLRLATASLQAQDEEWMTERRSLSVGSLSAVSSEVLPPVNARFVA